MFPFKADLNGSSPSNTYIKHKIYSYGGLARQMMIYIRWSLPLPPAWVVSWSCLGQLNCWRPWKNHFSHLVFFYLIKTLIEIPWMVFVGNIFQLKCIILKYSLIIVFPLHMLKVLRYCNVKSRAHALAYLNIEILLR